MVQFREEQKTPEIKKVDTRYSRKVLYWKTHGIADSTDAGIPKGEKDADITQKYTQSLYKYS